MALCCFYEERRSEEKKTVCTTDPHCPELEGYKLLGKWSVEKCDDCFRSAKCDDDDAPPKAYEAISEGGGKHHPRS